MPCYRPLRAYRGPPGESGKPSVVFQRSSSVRGTKLDLPCGQCIGCRLEKSRQWAMRCVHEASLHDENSFITLTYSDDFLPENKSLDVTHFQKFMKRLRKKFAPRSIRFFHCGEYGDATARPHYHALLFNFDFPDKIIWKESEGNNLYTSAALTKIWGFGHCVIGDLSFDSAAYCARYALKKITGDMAAAHYKGRKPEYVTMSRRPGIGKGWYDKYSKETYQSDSVVVRGREMRPPKFYDNLLEKTDPDLLERLKKIRIHKAKKLHSHYWKNVLIQASEGDLWRLIVKERVKIASIKNLKRNVE